MFETKVLALLLVLALFLILALLLILALSRSGCS